MAAKSARIALVEIGSRGTVGSLVLREIEYFRKYSLGPHNNNSCCHFADVASTNGISKPKIGNPKKKKRGCKNAKKFLPSMCSMVEVIESNNNRPRAISGFTYKNLKADVKGLDRAVI
nr:uncharacterized protein LOC104245940 [Ipomoea batatas]